MLTPPSPMLTLPHLHLHTPSPMLTHPSPTPPLHQDIIDNLIKHIEYCHCSNFTYLIGALYVYKGLLVVFGLFLAYESRNVKYFYINDSRFVTIAMYIVVILVGIGATISLVLTQSWFGDPAYGLAVFMVIASCLSCLLILYVPKVWWSGEEWGKRGRVCACVCVCGVGGILYMCNMDAVAMHLENLRE